MATAEVFVKELAAKGKVKKDPALLDGVGADGEKGSKDALEKVLAGRKGDDKDDTARIALEKIEALYTPTIRAALAAGGKPAETIKFFQEEVEGYVTFEMWKDASAALEKAYDISRSTLAGHKKEYEDARKAAMDKAISGALGLPEIGGGAVASALAVADGLANTGKWAEAKSKLAEVQADAEKVAARAPFIRACRRHEATIKAAFAITHNDLGKGYKAAWEQATKVAESGAFDSAGREVEELAKKIEKDKNDPALKQKREEVAQERTQNVEAMKESLKGGKPDVGELRKLVTKEIGGGDTPALSKQANELGDDPGAKSREAMVNETKAEDLFKKHDWFKLKELLHKEKLSTDAMWDCWRFRQQFVTRLIDSIRKRFPTLISKTSGSTDLESDIDITFASTEPGDDVKAAAMFNAAVKAKFGKPPGRVFDVNIYPRDYNAIPESINPDYNVNPIKDKDIDQPEGAMQKLSRVDQDVATLLKQRRFLDDNAFQELMNGVLDGISDPATKKQVQKQFEEGEDLYLLTSFEKVDKITANLNEKQKAQLKQFPKFEALRGKGDKGDQKSVEEAQKLLPLVLDELESELPAEVMEATDKMYLEKMGKLREDQVKIGKLDDPTAQTGEHHEGPCEEVHKGQEHADWCKRESERLKAQVKKDQFENIIFANEAYMSQGAIEHVVAGIQAKDPEKKAEILAKLTPATLMQSCNEQLADFFKDMKSSEEKIAGHGDEDEKRRETGEAFVHASKYLVRMLDAAQILVDKFAKFEPPVPLEFELTKRAKVASPKDLQAKVEGVLLALRKSSTIPTGVKGEVGVDEARNLFGVEEIGAFRKLISDFGVELNQKVRTAPEFKSELAVDQETERQYFGVPEMPSELRTLLDEAAEVLNAPLGQSAIVGVIAEAEGEVLASGEALGRAIPDNEKAREVAADRIEDDIIRAEDVLARLKKADVKGLLGHAKTINQKGNAAIGKLNGFDDEELHEAYQGDIAKAVQSLEAKVQEAEDAKTEVQEGLKEALQTLTAAIGKLKTRKTELA